MAHTDKDARSDMRKTGNFIMENQPMIKPVIIKNALGNGLTFALSSLSDWSRPLTHEYHFATHLSHINLTITRRKENKEIKNDQDYKFIDFDDFDNYSCDISCYQSTN